MRLENRIALVTGASKGIGRALAIGLAREGADVVLNYASDQPGAAATAAEVMALGRRALVLKADLRNVAEIHGMFEEVRQQWSRLDVLVNNAGVTGWTALFDTTEEEWDRVVDTNLKGTFFSSVEAARLMCARDGGSIVNISTNCVALGLRNLTAYAASKGGVHALTRQLAVELAPHGIRVNTFAPGPTRVERNLRDDPDYDRTWGEVVPLGRTASPEEMVGTAVYLASADSSFVTGQVFYADGGWSVSGNAPERYLEQALRKNREAGARTPDGNTEGASP